MKFSQSGNDAIREINSARLAIFNGDPSMAGNKLGALFGEGQSWISSRPGRTRA